MTVSDLEIAIASPSFASLFLNLFLFFLCAISLFHFLVVLKKEDLSFALTLVLLPPVVVVDEEDVDGDRGVDEEGHGGQLQNFVDISV